VQSSAQRLLKEVRAGRHAPVITDFCNKIGTKRTFSCRPAMSAFGGKADIEIAARDVCF
jgi:hypothetical protein